MVGGTNPGGGIFSSFTGSGTTSMALTAKPLGLTAGVGRTFSLSTAASLKMVKGAEGLVTGSCSVGSENIWKLDPAAGTGTGSENIGRLFG